MSVNGEDLANFDFHTGKKTPSKMPAESPGIEIDAGFKDVCDGRFFVSNPDKPTLYKHGVNPVWTPICGYAEVVAKVQGPDGCGWGRLVRWKTRDGHTKEKIVLMRDLLNNGGTDAILSLVDEGFFVFPGCIKATVEYLMLATTPSKMTMISDRIGWVGSQVPGSHPPIEEVKTGTGYILPNRYFGSNQSVHFSVGTSHNYRVSGTLAEWQENVGKLCSGNSRLLVAASCAFASPLLRLVNAEGGGIHLYGPSTLGKTTALRVAGSVCGGGGPDGFLDLWRATDNALEGVANLHNDCLLVLDELHMLNPFKASEIAYMLSNGQGKGRMRSDASLRKNLQWKLIFLSSGELTLAEHASKVGAKTTAGTDIRMLNIPADVGRGHGLFEYLHGRSDGKTFSDELKDATHKYFGTALEAYLEKLVTDPDKAVAFTRQAQANFFEANRIEDASGEVGRALDRFALLAAAGELATDYGITTWKPGEATLAARVCFDAWLDDRGTAGAFDVDRAIIQIRKMLEEFGESRFGQLNGYVGTPKDRIGFRRQVEGHTEFLVLPEMFKQELCRGFDPKAVADELIRRGYMKRDADGRHQLKVKNLPDGVGTRVYCISDAIFTSP